MELKQLFPIAKGYQYYIVTEKNEVTKNEIKSGKSYFLFQQERRNWKYTFLQEKGRHTSLQLELELSFQPV